MHRTFLLFLVVLQIAACSEQLTPEERRLLTEDRQSVLLQAKRDVDSQAGTLIASCMAILEGRTPKDLKLIEAPFSKTVEGDKIIYRGRWQGERGSKIDRPILQASSKECVLPSIDQFGFTEARTIGKSRNVISPKPVVTQSLRKAGYDVSAFIPVSLGGVFLRATLGGLVPGNVIRTLEGTMSASSDADTFTIRVFDFREKGYQRLVGTLISIGRSSPSE